MTRKDYKLVASALRAEREYIIESQYQDVMGTELETLDRVIKLLISAFKADNPRFDEEKFMIASQYGIDN